MNVQKYQGINNLPIQTIGLNWRVFFFQKALRKFGPIWTKTRRKAMKHKILLTVFAIVVMGTALMLPVHFENKYFPPFQFFHQRNLPQKETFKMMFVEKCQPGIRSKLIDDWKVLGAY